jgi:hypothetical protein
MLTTRSTHNFSDIIFFFPVLIIFAVGRLDKFRATTLCLPTTRQCPIEGPTHRDNCIACITGRPRCQINLAVTVTWDEPSEGIYVQGLA